MSLDHPIREFRELFVGISNTFVAYVAGATIGFGSQVLFARLLGADAFGEFVFVVAWVTILALIGKAGLDGSVSRFSREALAVGNEAGAGGVARYAVIAGVLISVVVASVALVTVLVLVPTGNITMWIVALVCLPLVSAVGIECGALRAFGYPAWSVSAQACVRPLASAAALLVIYYVGMGVDGSHAMIAFMIGFAGAFAVTHYLLGRRIHWQDLPRPPAPARRDIHNLGIALIGATGAILVMRQADIVMLGVLQDTRTAGLYSAAVRIVDFVAFPLIAANTLIGPLVAESFARSEKRDLQNKIASVFRVLSGVTILLAITVILSGHFLLGIFGDEFRQASGVLGVLLAGQIVNVVSGPGIEVLSNSGHHKIATFTLWLFAVVNIFLNWILIPLYDIWGAAFATALSLAAWNISLAILAARMTGIRTFIELRWFRSIHA